MNGPTDSGVGRWLERSRELGFLGPGPIEAHVTHAAGFAEVVGEPPTSTLDLGAGGGIPGLVLAGLWRKTSFVLLDSSQRRTDFLREALAALDWEGRVQVVRSRAEVVGREDSYRGWFDVVVSRSFGSPPVTAECAAPLLRVGGQLVVSEPPGENDGRWPRVGVAILGLAYEGRVTTAQGRGYAVLRQDVPCSVMFPRRQGVPGKRPLW